MNNEFIIFGLTPRSRKNLEFLRYCELDHMVKALCGLNKEQYGKNVWGKPVLLWDESEALNIPFFLSVGQNDLPAAVKLLESSGCRYSDDLIRLLSFDFGLDATELSRRYCSFVHEYRMDKYYEEAESDLGIFWSAGSPFYRMFATLDLSNVVELACGHGRHVNKYIHLAGSVTLVDILEKNISFCKERFSGDSRIKYYRNNGHDLAQLKDNSYSSLFSYDSMVHFEMIDIYRYLHETRRILKPGGRALFHHSNMMVDPRQSFYRSFNSGARTFMSKDLFAHLSYQAGLSVIEQQIIDWTEPKMDCITLLKKE